MNASTPMSVDDPRFDRACQWFIDLREQPESAELVAEWLAWCRADPLNREAFERAREVWQATSDVAPGDAIPAIHPPPREQGNVRAGVRRVAIPFAIAASVAILAVVIYRFSALFYAGTPASVIATAVGENRTARLADGSTVAVGARSKIAAHIDARGRQITLEEGEAYFRVKRDSARPFVVTAGSLRVTALGTAFNVRTSSGRVVVSVEEGLVEISSRSSKPERLTAGQQAAIDMQIRTTQVSSVESGAVASWQTGRLEFTREPLRDVLASINRYSRRPLTLSNDRLGDLRFTGTVFSDRVQDWLRGLPKVFPVEVRETDGAVVISGIPR